VHDLQRHRPVKPGVSGDVDRGHPAASDAGLDTVAPVEWLVVRQLGAVARYESEHKARRVRSAYQQRILNGGFGCGIRRFGYEKDGITIRASEAAEITKASNAILADASLRSIVRDLNGRGVTTTTGRPWTHQRLGGARADG
jgi:site-specific DNA recombinase